MDAYQVKQYLDAIIDRAYPGLDERDYQKYHRFYVKLLEKVLRSKLGDYTYSTHVIRVFGLHKSQTVSIIVITIHELAHHIDWCQRGCSNHQKPFYAVYKKLLYAGLDLKIFTPDQYINSIRETREFNIVCKMLEEYCSDDTAPVAGYKDGLSRIDVRLAFSIKDTLKEHGFKYDSVTKCWYKELSPDKIETEKRFLDSINADYEVSSAMDVSFKANVPLPDKWCGHKFTDTEKEKLEKGDAIQIDDCVSPKTGRPFFCNLKWHGGKFDVEFLSAIEIPESWSGHVFAADEKSDLEYGKKVLLMDCVSAKSGKPFICSVKWKQGRIEPTFIDTRVVPNVWRGHVFTEEEKARLVFGDWITLDGCIPTSPKYKESAFTIYFRKGKIEIVVEMEDY